MKTVKTNLGISLVLALLTIGIANAKAETDRKEKAKESKELKEAKGKKDLKEAKEKEETRPPIGCYNAGYKFELQALHLHPGENGQNQSLYFFFNTLNQPVSLYQMRDQESSRSLYLNHVIGPREWGILSTSEKQVKYICAVPNKKSQYGKVVDCEQTLRVCEYTNVRYGLNNRGNYWLVNNSSRNGAVSSVVYYGIIPGI